MIRKPLVVFTPKSLLRHPACVSKLEEFTEGGFKEVIDDVNVKVADVTRIVFCSGKIYYELLEKQQADKIKHVALVRVEQLYPTPVDQMEAIQKKYKNAEEIFWVQEEPENMGAWPYLFRRLYKTALKGIDVISRRESSSTATGFAKQHANQQAYILAKALELPIKQEEVKEATKKASKKMAEAD